MLSCKFANLQVICLLSAPVYWEPKLQVLYQGSPLGLNSASDIAMAIVGLSRVCSVWVEYIQLHRCQRINIEHAIILQC